MSESVLTVEAPCWGGPELGRKEGRSDIAGLRDGTKLGVRDGLALGISVGHADGPRVGESVGCILLKAEGLEGASVGVSEGVSDGGRLGTYVGTADGDNDGECVVSSKVGATDGAALG